MLSMHMFVLPELVYCASSPKWLTKVIMRQNKMWYTGPMAIIWHTFNAWLCISLNYPCAGSSMTIYDLEFTYFSKYSDT